MGQRERARDSVGMTFSSQLFVLERRIIVRSAAQSHDISYTTQPTCQVPDADWRLFRSGLRRDGVSMSFPSLRGTGPLNKKGWCGLGEQGLYYGQNGVLYTFLAEKGVCVLVYPGSLRTKWGGPWRGLSKCPFLPCFGGIEGRKKSVACCPHTVPVG